MLSRLRRTTREEFSKHITVQKQDSFAKTFVAKADMQELWDNCMGVWEDDNLLGAIIVSFSKRTPVIANLQLLHTFYASRGKGVGRTLCDFAIAEAHRYNATYFRVSAEADAVQFYEKCGFTFLGEQKSGSQLSMFKLNGPTYQDGLYDINDTVINKAVYRKGKGGCVKVFVKLEENPLLFP
jgi:GNAT superfamily N-acetyltransferase